MALNSILTFDEWMQRDWENGMARKKQMARLDNPNGSPFMVGEVQRNWLKVDLAKVAKYTPRGGDVAFTAAEDLQVLELLD